MLLAQSRPFDFPCRVVKPLRDGEFLRRGHFADDFALDALRLGNVGLHKKQASTAQRDDFQSGSGFEMPPIAGAVPRCSTNTKKAPNEPSSGSRRFTTDEKDSDGAFFHDLSLE